MGSCSPTPGHISGKDENTHLKRCMDPNVHSSTIHNSQDMEATYMSTNIGMDKETVVHIYKVVFFSGIKK